MNKIELIENLDLMKSLLIAAATGGGVDDNEYKSLRAYLINITSIKNELPLVIKSNHNPREVFCYMQSMFSTYKERREFITKEMNKLIEEIGNFGENTDTLVKAVLTGWEKIDISLSQLKENLTGVSDRISYNEIGVRCRETLKLLSNEVYDDSLHHPSDFIGDISPDDVKRKFDGYFEYVFSGKSYEHQRSYARACNNLSNFLTHSSILNKRDAILCINATVSLINMVKAIEKYKSKK